MISALLFFVKSTTDLSHWTQCLESSLICIFSQFAGHGSKIATFIFSISQVSAIIKPKIIIINLGTISLLFTISFEIVNLRLNFISLRINFSSKTYKTKKPINNDRLFAPLPMQRDWTRTNHARAGL